MAKTITTKIPENLTPLSRRAISQTQVDYMTSKLARAIALVTGKIGSVKLYYWLGHASACVTPPKKGETAYTVYLGDKLQWTSYCHVFGLKEPEPKDILGTLSARLESMEEGDAQKMRESLAHLVQGLCMHEYGHVLVSPMTNFDKLIGALKRENIPFQPFNLMEDIAQENQVTAMTGYRFHWQKVLPLVALPDANQIGCLRKLALLLLYRKGMLKDVGDGSDVDALSSTLVFKDKPVAELAREMDTAFHEIISLNAGVLDHYMAAHERLSSDKSQEAVADMKIEMGVFEDGIMRAKVRWLADFMKKYPEEKAPIKEQKPKDEPKPEQGEEEDEGGGDDEGDSAQPQEGAAGDGSAKSADKPKDPPGAEKEGGDAKGSSKAEESGDEEANEDSSQGAGGKGEDEVAEEDMEDANLDLPEMLEDMENSAKAAKDPGSMEECSVDINPPQPKKENGDSGKEGPGVGHLDSVRAGKVLTGKAGDQISANFLSTLRPITEEEELQIGQYVRQLNQMLGEKTERYLADQNNQFGVNLSAYTRMRQGIQSKHIWEDRRTVKRRKSKKTLHFILDCSGSMQRYCAAEKTSASRVGVLLLVALNRLASLGHVQGSVILSGWVGKDAASVRYPLPTEEQTLLKIKTDMGHEGLQPTLSAYLPELKKDPSAQIIVYTDADITDEPLNRTWLNANKLAPWGVYVGEPDSHVVGEMEKHFHNRHVILPTLKETLTVLVKRVTS